jgi:hypothetical protein
MDLPDYMRPTKKFNIPLARKVLEFAEEEHDDFDFDMGDWFSEAKFRGKKKICNTSACLAGTAAFLAPEAKVDVLGIVIGRDWFNHEEGGAYLLGLTERAGSSLFYNYLNYEALDMLRAMIEYAETHEDSLEG